MFSTSADRDRFEQRFLAEAHEAGIAAEPSNEVELETMTAGQQAGQLLKMAVTSEAQARITHVRAYALRSPGRVSSLYIQPFQGGAELAGEFHIRLSGAAPEPAVFTRRGFFSKRWVCDDRTLLGRLEGARGLAAATKELSWAKQSQLGSIGLDWTVQLWHLGGGVSQLAMKSGTYGQLAQRNGVALFLQIAAEIAPLLDRADGNVMMYFPTLFQQHAWLEQLWETL